MRAGWKEGPELRSSSGLGWESLELMVPAVHSIPLEGGMWSHTSAALCGGRVWRREETLPSAHPGLRGSDPASIILSARNVESKVLADIFVFLSHWNLRA